ncbi:acetyl esterase/lipase [Saccharothrix ecbatanensis]|uniref:Acetyl esterase/lipase n=1 Tax=Saccharothrix ecbatanensis TaxID=1105145 RepID=A0A7W9M1E9_9PSEU|nr:alpha/beta hydrolase [Saccharothrix ecbatanensis]MBB5803742.1 acetyl esterase/lipase [Saccharothrix ecbatanensis]
MKLAEHLIDTSERRPAVLVLPGGSYLRHADHEAEPVAQWLNGLGLHAFVLRYRVDPHRHPAGLLDARQALHHVRQHAQVDPHRVGVLGFSAGGHLAGMLATGVHPTGEPSSADERPDFAVLCYPVISLDGADGGHQGCGDRLLGDDADSAARATLAVDRHVDARTPPTFLWHTADDEAVPVVNSLRYAEAAARHDVPVELHVYPHGKHGLGLAVGEPAGAWTGLCADWLVVR